MAKNDIFTGGGRLYFQRLNADGSHEPIMYFGKTDGISFATSVEWKEHYNSEGCTPLLDAKYPSKKSAEIKFETSQITLEMQNNAFLGNIISSDQVIATAEAVAVASDLVKQGHIVDLGYYNITALTETTYAEGDDFTLDAKSGFVYIKTTEEGGSIPDGTALAFQVTAPAITMNTSATMKNSALQGRFIVITSSQTGNNYKYVFKNVSVTQDGDFLLKGEEIGTLSFSGSAMVDTVDNGILSDYLDIIELDSSEC